MTPGRVVCGIGFLAWAPWALAQGEGPAAPRGDLAELEAALDQAVRKVSAPAAAPFLGGGEASRAYRLPGYGTLFVVPPRLLPRAGRVVVVRDARPGAAPVVASSEEAPTAPPANEDPPSAVERRELRIEREIQVQARTRQREAREKELRAMEEKVEALQREMQHARQEAEQALDRTVREAMQIRITGDGIAAVAPVAPPAAPAAPSAPGPLPAPAPPAPLPPAPPWRFWFNNDEREDARAPNRVVADVKGVLAQALETYGPRLRSLRPEESVVVVVDFLSPWGFEDEPRAEKTLIIRVRKKDLDEKQAGRIASEELRKRIEYVEY